MSRFIEWLKELELVEWFIIALIVGLLVVTCFGDGGGCQCQVRITQGVEG